MLATYVDDPAQTIAALRAELAASRQALAQLQAETVSDRQAEGKFRSLLELLVTGVIRDITVQQQAAAELERQVERRTVHLNALLQFSGELLAARGLDAVLQSAMGHALALIP